MSPLGNEEVQNDSTFSKFIVFYVEIETLEGTEFIMNEIYTKNSFWVGRGEEGKLWLFQNLSCFGIELEILTGAEFIF